MTALAISVFDFPHREVGGECCSCLGIDVQSFRGAPGDELVRVDYRADDGKPAALGSALLALSLFAPSVIGGRQDVRVHHDLQNARIPGQPYCAHHHAKTHAKRIKITEADRDRRKAHAAKVWFGASIKLKRAPAEAA